MNHYISTLDRLSALENATVEATPEGIVVATDEGAKVVCLTLAYGPKTSKGLSYRVVGHAKTSCGKPAFLIKPSKTGW